VCSDSFFEQECKCVKVVPAQNFTGIKGGPLTVLQVGEGFISMIIQLLITQPSLLKMIDCLNFRMLFYLSFYCEIEKRKGILLGHFQMQNFRCSVRKSTGTVNKNREKTLAMMN